MTNPQGTAWETEIVNRCEAVGVEAMRLVKQGQKDEADVLIGYPPYGGVYFKDKVRRIPALLWKRIVKGGSKNRQPLGERYVAVLALDDYLWMVERIEHAEAAWPPIYYIQAKWAEQISVTKTLKGLRDWLSSRMEST